MRNNFAFIDSQNLNLSVKAQGWDLDYKRFRKYLEEKLGVTQAFLFIGYIQKNQRLYTALQKKGYVLIFKPTMILPSGKVKGNVDAELVLHTMIEWPNYEKAVIISGDGDFSCLIEHLDKHNKLEKLVIPNQHNYSSLLRPYTKFMLHLTPLKFKLEYRKFKK
ncbi:MAG: NYN domain-containing protein [Candidatus Aminicenantes bacterium]|nr:NYN domain-containing protein [Candidatus Aminicenantes bacterium]